ncbi:hypothetical protein HPB47_000630 [Ixodes persulcatus]|uniref:Uncharacterized protein n=1 Tax=Ixodes persulcatus TaxID=34615 RepID=A0AC60PRE5_IXOPE|nr:hypothetical protein HPB47_000630 [Ixodes persulcatus]
MPASASLFPDMERGSGLEDQRALQLALELSMLGLNNEHDSLHPNFEADTRNKKSQNTTECVPVPSSEHVAEIVGRQGCKIKALRAKTNTYIKTPVRGEEPVFVVTGRKEDVGAAKREILSAAEHFSQIRAQRKNNLNGSLAPGPNSNIPGQTTIQVRVPYRVVGLVVGPKGATIKRIQQQTNTYIIEAHIAMRTGGSLDDEPPPPEGSFPEGPPSRQDLFSFPANPMRASETHPPSTPRPSPGPDFARGTNGDAFAAPPPVRGGPLRRDAGPDSVASSPTDSLGSTGGGPPAPGKRGKRDCVVCFESEVVAALVPCGHNMFCMECANRVCGKGEPQCPVCHQPCAHAIRIYS